MDLPARIKSVDLSIHPFQLLLLLLVDAKNQ
jgi:hypothetical protein